MSIASNNTLELLIAKAASAQKAGVFDSTQVDVSALVDSGVNSRLIRFYEKALVGLPLAACLGIVIGIGSMIGGPNGQSPAVVSNGGTAVTSHGLTDSGAVTELCSFESVTRCFAGPGEVIDSECGCADLDSDGDVDLVDLGTYQQQYALMN